MNDPNNQQDLPLILALDTSARSTGIALARGEQIIARLVVAGDERRSERLWLDIAELLEGAGLSVAAVDLFAVCVGPGGFTGLRVGIAAIKGMAAATGKPVAGVTSLEAAAMAASGAAAVCALVGAYKGEAYSQRFTFDAHGLPVARSAPIVSTSTEAIAQVADTSDVVFVGDAAEANGEMIREVAGASVHHATESIAEAVARVACLKWQHGSVKAAIEVEAVYVRPAEAEVKRSLGLLGSKIARSRRAD